jgi:hypothetical protein
MTISVEEIGKVRNFVLKQVTKENRCLVLGTEDMIDDFCKGTGVSIDYIMTDMLNIDNEIESVPAKLYNPKSGEVVLIGLTGKDYLVDMITQSRRMDGEDIKEDLRYILGVQLVKKGGAKSADVMCGDSEEEKIKMVEKIFRRPPKKIIDDMTELSKDVSIIEVDERFNRSIKQNPQIHEKYAYANESLCETLGITDDRFEELRQILLKLTKLSISSGNINNIMTIDHNIYLDLLEKEEEISHREMLYLALGEGSILQQCATQFNEKLSSLEEDRDERIKSIGKRYACEISKSLTLSKIDNLKLNLRDKLKANFWAGIYNCRFYEKENEGETKI